MKSRQTVLYVVLALSAFAAGLLITYWGKGKPQSGNQVAVVLDAGRDVDAAVQVVALEGMPTDQSGAVLPDAPAMPVVADEDTFDYASPDEVAVITGKSGTPVIDEFDDVPKVDPMMGVKEGAAFSLVDHNGNAVTEKSWPDKTLAVFFGFTHCPDICPAGLQKLTDVVTATPTLTDSMQILMITVDPARDTVEEMKEYMSNYHDSFIGLTGTEEQIKAAVKSYNVYTSRDPANEDGSYAVYHSPYVYLVAKDRTHVKLLNVTNTVENMSEDIAAFTGVTAQEPTTQE